MGRTASLRHGFAPVDIALDTEPMAVRTSSGTHRSRATVTTARDAVVVVGSDAFHAEMRANPTLDDRLLLCFSVADVIDEPPPVAGGEVLVSAAALREIRTRRAPEFPGAACVVVLDDDRPPSDPLGSPLSRCQRAAKRLLDVLVAGIALVVAAPLILVLVLLTRLTLREPGIFTQERVGEGGRTCRIHKIRTMVTSDDRHQQAYAEALIRGEAQRVNGLFKVHDHRITGLGRWLRRLSLDELPQLWNVLRGDMSLVGPRRPLPSEVAHYDAMAWQRLRVKPGITGPWQVGGRCTLPFEQMIELDVAYWRRWSLGRDLTIAARTPLVMLSGRGAA